MPEALKCTFVNVCMCVIGENSFRQDGLWARDLTKRNMKQVYDDSGYTWCDADKKEELIEHGGAARFLIARKKRTGV